MERSTRLSIVEHALEDARERLADAPPSKERDALEALVRRYTMEVGLWNEHPPDEATRVRLTKSILDLNVLVIQVGGAARRAQLTDDELDADDDYPKPIRS